MAAYYFRLPAITQLTIDQQSALAEAKQIALSGGPGTGKSVVSIWRHISNYEKNRKSLLLTYTTTLKQYLKACCRLQNLDASVNVGTLYRNRPIKKWDEVIIDEAQDMSNDYYRDIDSPVSYGADDSQILYPEHCSTQAELSAIFPKNVKYVLGKNFRSTQRIMLFSKQAFPNANIPISTIRALANNIGEKPVLLISNGNRFDITNDRQNNAIERVINSFRADDHNIAILVPLKSDVNMFEQVLDQKGIDYSVYYEDRERFPRGSEAIKNIHLTTFKSAKGLEFDTVIIPNFHNYDNNNLRVIKWQDYYVACTRARSNLYLISNYDLPNLNSVTEMETL